MNIIQNPVRDRHWASSRLPAFLAGKHPKLNSTTIQVAGRAVGIVQDGVFLKKVNASIHFLRIPPAISFDLGSLKQAEKAGACIVKVIDKETGRTYRAYLSTIWRKGFEFNRGHGQQIGLPLSLWSKGNEPFIEQMFLWGEL